MIRKRIGQGLRSLRPPAVTSDELEVADSILTPTQFKRFQMQPGFDQSHQVRVCRWLQSRGVTDQDFLTAALLHDIGKSANGGRVTTLDRTARVGLRKLSPSLLGHLANTDNRLHWKGIVLAVHHPEIGAAEARVLGCTDRVCWLIANHESPIIADPDLILLQQADSAS